MRYFYMQYRVFVKGCPRGDCQICIRLTTLQIVDKDDEGYWAKHNFLRHFQRVPSWRKFQLQLPFPYGPADSSWTNHVDARLTYLSRLLGMMTFSIESNAFAKSKRLYLLKVVIELGDGSIIWSWLLNVFSMNRYITLASFHSLGNQAVLARCTHHV